LGKEYAANSGRMKDAETEQQSRHEKWTIESVSFGSQNAAETGKNLCRRF